MDRLDVSKENIQPLKRGRNIVTLNTALQAQTDTEAHQQLMREREEFEILLRSYVGDDPLKPWYDYVLWVEQNFPKHGREGNLKVLLENCLLEFKDKEQYFQDVRCIDLWTRYMSFVDDPFEMYKLIHARGIGTSCAIFYQCWAEEYEKANDMKRADQIYIEGIRRNAQPNDELVSAHTNFQVRVARSILGQNPVINQEHFVEERTALSALRAHGRKKNMVDSTRIGNSIKRATPGVLRPHSNVPLVDQRSGNVQFSKLAVYSDENAPFTDAVSNPVVKSSVSLSQQVTSNKENISKPGRWNEGKFKKKSSASAIGTSGVPATPRNPTFQVHVDENSGVPRTPKTDIVVSNVLKMRKHVYEDEKNIPVAMFEPTDPRKIAMYPKSKVYSGGTEFSLEELRAITYLKRERERQKTSIGNESENNVNFKISEMEDNELQVADQEINEFKEEQEYISKESRSQQLNDFKQEDLISEKIELELERSQQNSFQVFVEAEEEMNAKLKMKKPQHTLIQKEKKSVVPPSQSLRDVPFSGYLKIPKFPKEHKKNQLQLADEMFQSGPSFEQKECDQSLTVNTKAVINEVKGMWGSSPPSESTHFRGSFVPRRTLYNTTLPTEGPVSAPATLTPFKIFSDGSALEEPVSCVNVHTGKASEGRAQHINLDCIERVENSNLWGARQVDDIGRRRPVIPSAVPQVRVVPPEDVSDTVYLTEKEVAELQALNKGCVLQNERETFKSAKEATMIPQTLPEFPSKISQGTRRDFSVYTDPSFISIENNAMPDPQVGIPFVASPGMTPAQLVALQGSEDKENVLMGKPEQMPLPDKSRKSVLQPSKDVYFVPLEKQLAEEEVMVQNNLLSDETCSTEAFAIPLVSSTPMVHLQLKTCQEGKQDPTTQVEDNVLSDETCCTEAFAIPLVSSTPMLHLQLKSMHRDGNQAEGEDDTIALMNLCQKNANIAENVPYIYEATPKTSTVFIDQVGDVAELPYSAPRMSVPSAQLSTIFELSEQKKSLGTTDSSGASKSSRSEVIPRFNCASKYISPTYNKSAECEFQEELEFFRNLSKPQKNVAPPQPLAFFSDDFRDCCMTKIKFPSELHRSHCVLLQQSFDIDIRPGSAFLVGENRYTVLNLLPKENKTFRFTAFESFSKQMVEIEVKDNAYLWEQYIKEEIRLRIKDPAMVDHFIANERTYIYTNKHLLFYNKCNRKNLEEDIANDATFSKFFGVVSDIFKILFHLHQCNIVHGSLSMHSFLCLSNSLLLNGFEKAVDTTLLPADVVFDATEESIYSMLHACRLSPFQVDYIALANILHFMIFRKSMKVHMDMEGIWNISSTFSGIFDENLWGKVFRELLNRSNVNLLDLHCLLEEHVITNNDRKL